MADRYATVGTVLRGALKIRRIAEFVTAMAAFEQKPVVITVEQPHATRSPQANRYYWGVVVSMLADYFHLPPDTMHATLAHLFNADVVDLVNGEGEVLETVGLGGSTSQLNRVEFSEYVARIRDWSGTTLGVEIPSAHEVWGSMPEVDHAAAPASVRSVGVPSS
jgi:hypothetical protein